VSTPCGDSNPHKNCRSGEAARATLSRPTSNGMSGIPSTTVERIAVIARGNLDSKGASDFLKTTFDASDYPQALNGHLASQQFIDSLYHVRHPFYPRERSVDPASARFLVATPTRQRANSAFWRSGRRWEKPDSCPPITTYHIRSIKMRCQMQLAGPQTFGKRPAQTALSLLLKSSV